MSMVCPKLSFILYCMFSSYGLSPKDVPYCNSVRTSNLRKTPRLERTDPGLKRSSPPTGSEAMLVFMVCITYVFFFE